EKAKPRPKVVDSSSLSELDAKNVFRFFPGASVGSPKSFRGFRLFPRQGLWGMVGEGKRHYKKESLRWDCRLS
ncbi:hypothetical protein ABDI12_25335, partial [Brevibacillus agri]